MHAHTSIIQKLVSLPAPMAEHFSRLENRTQPEWVAAGDPPGKFVGSGGGAVHLLAEAWRQTGRGQPFSEWLKESRKLILNGGGPSRRLPAYAAISNLNLPVPVFRWIRGQRLDQTLLDLQWPSYQRIFAHSPDSFRLMITSGNVLLRCGRNLPAFPDVDVLCLGLWIIPEMAKDFGVVFSPRQRPNEIGFFLQKPSVARIRLLNPEYLPLVDTGIRLLSERAVSLLMEMGGWQDGEFGHGGAQAWDFYAKFGASLGSKPEHADARISSLSAAVVALPETEFYYLNSTRNLIEAVSRIQSLELDESKIGLMGARQYPSQFLQNCRFEFPLCLDSNHTIWVENSVVPSSWRLASEHALTGVPENNWELQLERGVCLDFAPVKVGRAVLSAPKTRTKDRTRGALGTARPNNQYCVRVYHIDDAFEGKLGDAGTHWLGQPVMRWFEKRRIGLKEANLDPAMDIHEAALFPVLPAAEIDPRFIAWLFQQEPAENPGFRKRWLAGKRLSAAGIIQQLDLEQYFAQQSQNRTRSLPPMLKNARFSVFYKLDLGATAKLAVEGKVALPTVDVAARARLEPMQQVRDEMFRSAVGRLRQEKNWKSHTQRAFQIMRELIIQNIQLTGVRPQKSVYSDQIIWGRAPVRLDLAGGWTDTPPYCLEHGGSVVNVAVDLNGQPPIQVFARIAETPELVLRSIDLGLEHRVRTYEELATFNRLDSAFPFAKAACALAGFLPDFLTSPHYGSLREQFEDFGGGIELSMLAAVPKGSGLGTSSILGTTLLAALSDLCGLDWNLETLFIRTLALEQMCTTGGGWQDQAGGIYRGVKLVETQPGIVQRPLLQWLPEHVFSEESRNQSILLYYTGVTRLAKNILDEIVRSIFLNAGGSLRIIEDIGANAAVAASAIQSCNYQALVESVRTSWNLNQALDSGTNPEPIQSILNEIQDYLTAAKLLGAGGGGYLLMFAKDKEAGNRIRKTLTEHPPNAGARFVDFTISQTGLQRTRS